jgi:hypothetical protein
MQTDDDRDQTVRRIVLPSGKTIEVLRVLDGEDQPAVAPVEPPAEAAEPPKFGAAPVETGEPHLCPDCASSLVYPVAWTAAGDESWRVELRCPNCERTESALLDLEVAERFDEELERGAEVLMTDLTRLSEANMLDDVERFATALRADAILPTDF